jgi:hypothetical protein
MGWEPSDKEILAAMRKLPDPRGAPHRTMHVVVWPPVPVPGMDARDPAAWQPLGRSVPFEVVAYDLDVGGCVQSGTRWLRWERLDPTSDWTRRGETTAP